MIIRDSAKCPHVRVIDRSILCELLHPDNVAGAEALDCSIAHAIVPFGESTLPHQLQRSTELYYILKGRGEMHIGGGRCISAGRRHQSSQVRSSSYRPENLSIS